LPLTECGSIFFQIFVMSSERRFICAVECGTGRSRSSNVVDFGSNQTGFTDPGSRVLHGPYSEDFVIACVVLMGQQGLTDRRTDAFAMAKTGHLNYLRLICYQS